MMDDITWIHVASDAVKIGLGAAIGAVSVFLVTYLNHRHEESQEYSNRRRDLLEKIMPKFDEVSLEAMNQVVNFVEAVTEGFSVEGEIEKDRFAFEEQAENILNLNRELNLVESNVALLGYKSLAENVEEFRKGFRELVGSERGERIEAMRTSHDLSGLRYTIIDQFAEAYRSA